MTDPTEFFYGILVDADQPLTPRRGRRPGSVNPKDEPVLREVARRVVADHPKISRSAAIREIMGKPHKSEISRLIKKWRRLERVLLLEASQRPEVESYDPVLHANAPIGKEAWVNQNAQWKERADLAGWNIAEGPGDGELLIRRDLRGVPWREDDPTEVDMCLRRFVQSGFAWTICDGVVSVCSPPIVRKS